MENLIWATVLWMVTLFLVPPDRIKQLLPVALVTFIWFFTVNFFFIHFGYYRFTHILISVADVPLIQAIGGAAGGILLMNWLTPNPLSKILMVFAASGFFSLSEFIFVKLGAFVYGNGFTPFFSFVHSIAMVAILIWLSLAVVGEKAIYAMDIGRTRFGNQGKNHE